MTALFISDLHLTPQRADVTGAFELFLHELPQSGDSLYILGDLFEYWAGDDDLDASFNARIAASLAAVAERGIGLYFIHGNRDFLIGEQFAERARLALLPDPYVFTLHGMKTVLLHGDTLCTDDVKYQAFRTQVRAPGWQQAFLAQPLARRHAVIEGLREKSETEKSMKPADIMDVNEDEVRRVLTETGCARMIHGHTHRPGRHDYVMAGSTRKRWVLPAWDQHAGYLRVDAGGGALIQID
jgi:UDP-2,3-diacylglucosamine hydrolase